MTKAEMKKLIKKLFGYSDGGVGYINHHTKCVELGKVNFSKGDEMQKTDDEIIQEVQEAVDDLNAALKLCARAGIIIDLTSYDITQIEDRVRCHMYSFSADKRLVGGL